MNFISEDFHLHYLSSYTLYIKSGFNIDYLLVIGNEEEILVFLQYDNLQPSTEATRILALPFSKVIVNAPQQNLIWVPNDVYSDTDKELYTQYFLTQDVDKIIAKEIDSLHAVALYQYDPVVVNQWLKIYPEAQLVPTFEILLRQFKNYDFSSSDAVLAVHASEKETDILLFVNGEFKLLTSFEVLNDDDLSFYVLSIMKNFSLTEKFDHILLSGAAEQSEFANRLKSYTNRLEVLNTMSRWRFENEELGNVLLSLNLLVDTSLCE